MHIYKNLTLAILVLLVTGVTTGWAQPKSCLKVSQWILEWSLSARNSIMISVFYNKGNQPRD